MYICIYTSISRYIYLQTYLLSTYLGMYSVFSVFEYTVVLSNMAYHFTSYFDFYYVNIQIGTRVTGLALRGATRHE